MNDLAKNLIVWLVLAAVLFSVFSSFSTQQPDDNLGYSDFVVDVQNERVKKVIIEGLIVEGEQRDGTKFRSVLPTIGDERSL